MAKKLCTNPYTGELVDLDQVPTAPGGAKWCARTGMPLNHAAVDLYSYPGPIEDRAVWAAEHHAKVDQLEAEAGEPNHVTLGIDPPTHTVERVVTAAPTHTVERVVTAAPPSTS